MDASGQAQQFLDTVVEQFNALREGIHADELLASALQYTKAGLSNVIDMDQMSLRYIFVDMPVWPLLLIVHTLFVSWAHRRTLEAQKFKSTWSRSLVATCLSGNGGNTLNGILTGTPPKWFMSNTNIPTFAVSWYLVNFSPFDIVWKLLNFLPIKILMYTIEGAMLTRVLTGQVVFMNNNYPGMWFPTILAGILSVNGGGFVAWFEQFSRGGGAWSSISRPNTQIKIGLAGSLLHYFALNVETMAPELAPFIDPVTSQIAIGVFWSGFFFAVAVYGGDFNIFGPVDYTLHMIVRIPHPEVTIERYHSPKALAQAAYANTAAGVGGTNNNNIKAKPKSAVPSHVTGRQAQPSPQPHKNKKKNN